MAELRVRTIDESELDTVLAPDIDFHGEAFFDKPLLVKGTLKGVVRSDSDLYIADGATVHADVHARRVSIKGMVEGNVNASERIELFSGAGIVGNIECPDLIVQSGSKLNGSCTMPVSGVSSPIPSVAELPS